ncbi:Sec-independent protein translocase TatB [Kocuria rosea]|uniref:Sec-independent protein translocase TatB n=1 Tax=Kocuria rosea TaxID=1275 RepID=UPI0025B73EB1|nr:Sec-independent protein translocase TatB [Kocuria rosea]WJZ68398.1 Sec-independent protein translocase TatB [Kocuria rosea]
MFGINGAEMIVLVLLALFLVGPERLPEYAEKLKQLVKTAKRYATGATEDLKETLGPELADVDWRKLDPRQYDPRTIVRQALVEDEDAPAPTRRNEPVRTGLAPGVPAPFDAEST